MSWLSRTILNPAGGLRYHLRARRYSGALWGPFRREIGEWLERSWAPRRDTLIILGPSGGYCMSWHWLRRFQRVIAVDPDPLAHKIFRRKMKVAGVYADLRWIRRDLLSGGGAGLRELLEKEPGAAILFNNLAGQLRLLMSDEDLARFQAELPKLLEGRSWASFHDRFSGELVPRIPGDLRVFPARPSNELLIERFYRDIPEGGGAEGGASRIQTLLDHETEKLFPHDREHRYFRWELEPGYYHLIEGVCRS
jgi:hypothetical protein